MPFIVNYVLIMVVRLSVAQPWDSLWLDLSPVLQLVPVLEASSLLSPAGAISTGSKSA